MTQGSSVPTNTRIVLSSPAAPAAATKFRWTISTLEIPAGQEFQLILRGCWRADQVSAVSARGVIRTGSPSSPMRFVSAQVARADGELRLAFAAIQATTKIVSLSVAIDVTFSEPFVSAAAGTLLDIRIAHAGIRLPLVLAAGGPVGPPPADPAALAPALDRSVATDLMGLVSFLYAGPNRVQYGVVLGAITAQQVSLLRGRVVTPDADGVLQPLPGVAVTVQGQIGYGLTVSHADGAFDLVVNGGRPLDLVFEKPGYLPVRRQIQPRWHETRRLPDVVMTAQDASPAQKLDTGTIQVARGAEVEDADGKRQATLVVPAGTVAAVALPNGTTTKLTSFHVRALEYTVGPNGPQAMPASLPPTSAYTYCVEYSLDEAAGARDVQFSQPIFHYVENFLGFPVGSAVPMGSYDRQSAAWIPSENGRVVKILGVADSRAVLDIDGTGAASPAALDALKLGDAERQQLAVLYPVGPGEPARELWRVPIRHFSPWDCNWPYGPPPDATPPGQPAPGQPGPDDDCKGRGSIIGYQNQTLGEAVALVGTPLRLYYQSERVPGRLDRTSVDISLSGPSVPASLKRIDLEVHGAGQLFTKSFKNLPNQHYLYTWDGNDRYGRRLQGRQRFTVRLGYAYDAVYMEPGNVQQAFADYGTAITGIKSRQELVIWQEWTVSLGTWDHLSQGLGGWSLNAHHSYDPAAQVLYLGNGRRRTVGGLSLDVIATVAGGGKLVNTAANGARATDVKLDTVRGLALDSHGNLYIANEWGVRRIGADGAIRLYAGGGNPPDSIGDGGPATQASFQQIGGLAIGPDDSLYVADLGKKRVRRISPSGTISTVAGGAPGLPDQDGGPATQTAVDPRRLAVASDETLYILELMRLRRVATNGIITTIAADKNVGSTGDGGLAAKATLHGPQDIALGKDGSIYIAEGSGNRIRRVGLDGIIRTIAGTGAYESGGDGGPATEAKVQFPKYLAVSPDGSLYIAESNSTRLRRVLPDGTIDTFAGTGVVAQAEGVGDNGPPRRAQLGIPSGLAVGPDGAVCYADDTGPRVRRVGPALTWLQTGDIVIPADDGGEVYVFSSLGQHHFTLNAATGSKQHIFTYDPAGRLKDLTDADGLQTTIVPAPDGKHVMITAPGGQQTTLALDANGYLASVTNPAGETITLTYQGVTGLLKTLTDANKQLYTFSYDDMGRLHTVRKQGRRYLLMNKIYLLILVIRI